jgi:hypothetical protein
MANFRDQWDSLKPHGYLSAQEEIDLRESQTVLDNLQPRRGRETVDWLNEISDEILQVSPELGIREISPSLLPAAEEAEPKTNEVVRWVDCMFDHFEEMSADFNETAVGTKLTVAVQRPVFHYEEGAYGVYSEENTIAVFKGHLATRIWGMLIQGHQNTIDIYIVPSDRLLKFTFGDIKNAGFKPFMTIQSVHTAEGLQWRIDGCKLRFEMLPMLCKELLGDLVRVASGTMNEGELFSRHPKLKLGENIGRRKDPDDLPTYMGMAPYVPDAPANPAELAPQSVLASVVQALPVASIAGAAAPSVPTPAEIEGPDVRNLASWDACKRLFLAIDADFVQLQRWEAMPQTLDTLDAPNPVHAVATDLTNLKEQMKFLLRKYSDPSIK